MSTRRAFLFVAIILLGLLLPAAWAAPAGDWQPAGMLLASDGYVNTRFGNTVVLQGDTAVVGAPRWNSSTAEDVGAAYVFTHNGVNWTERTRLTASDSLATDLFGTSINLSGDTLAVGALYAWRVPPGQPGALSTGAIYIFTGSGATWTEQVKLAPDDLVQYNGFGGPLDLVGDTLIAGAPNAFGPENEAAYIFERVNGIWGAPQKLTAPPADNARNFGSSVEIAGDFALVGAPGNTVHDDERPEVPGVVYIFRRLNGVWQPAGTLTAPDGFAGDRFGCSIEYDGVMAVIRACHAGDSTRLPGYVYVFTRDGTTWTPAAAPPRDNTYEFEIDGFGLFGDRLVLGTTDFPVEPYKGRFLIYRREGSSWVAEPPIIQPDDAQVDDVIDTGFGGPVALNDEHFLAGASSLAPSDVYDQGGVYVFRSASEVVFTLFTPVVAAPPGE